MLTNTQKEFILAIEECLKAGFETEARKEISLATRRTYEDIRFSRRLGLSVEVDKEFLRELKRP